jgi:hypothetical protein
MEKIDFKKTLKHLYSASAKQPALVEVPEMKFLWVDGRGDPATSASFQSAMELLYGLSYTLKFALKKRGKDYSIPPLEGLWWMEGIEGFDMNRRGDWHWSLMVMQPDFITTELLAQARREVAAKRGESPHAVRFEPFHEGLCAQILHVGPYSTEGPTIEKLHRFVEVQGYLLRGRHHEIYLGDPRRSAPEKLKTLVRHPVRK